jgi:hypothetical protein
MKLASTDSAQQGTTKEMVSNRKAFHRTKKDSRILAFFGLMFSLFLSILFMLLGFHRIGAEGRASIELIFGIAGLALFIICLRGAWSMTGDALTHVFSVDQENICWGFIGQEKQLAIQDIAQIYWDESDGFHFVIITTYGERIRLPYMATVVSYQSRPVLLRFFRTTHPTIRIEGHIDKNSEKGSTTTSANISDS